MKLYIWVSLATVVASNSTTYTGHLNFLWVVTNAQLDYCRYTMVVLWGIVVPHIAHASFCDTVDCCRQQSHARMRHNDRSVFNHREKRRKPVFGKHDHLFKNKEDVTVDKTDEVEDQKVSPQFRF